MRNWIRRKLSKIIFGDEEFVERLLSILDKIVNVQDGTCKAINSICNRIDIMDENIEDIIFEITKEKE